MSLVLSSPAPGGVVTLTLNRPDRRNALSIALVRELLAALERAEAEPSTRVAVLRGAGAAFCTGLDLAEAQDSARAEDTSEAIAALLSWFARTRLVTIAAVHGAAVAGGAGLMSACDLVVAAAGTCIGYPEARRGLVPALVMGLLRRQVGEREARELLLTGELFDATRAREMGLVNRVVPASELDEAVRALVRAVLHNAPGALAGTKAFLDSLWPRPMAEDLARAHQHHVQMRQSPEAREGIAAFLEKRPASWAPPPG
jgi:methylglutaconyl-CoA hydratase